MIDSDCFFCLPTQDLIIETPLTYSTLNFSPATPGHFLVVPKKHFTNLSELPGIVHEDISKTIEKTYDHIKSQIARESSFLKDFYTELLRHPPFLYSDEYSKENVQYMEKILTQCNELSEPIGYNIGLNMNEGAGQRAAHIHYHVFPRYKKGLGVVNGMRCLLENEGSKYNDS